MSNSSTLKGHKLPKLFDRHDDAAPEPATREAVLRDALAELIACHDLKERAHKEGGIVHSAGLHAEYNRRRPLAWEAARAAMKDAS